MIPPVAGRDSYVLISVPQKDKQMSSLLETPSCTCAQTQPYDFVSRDRTVVITELEFIELEDRCPSIRNIRQLVRMACRGWLQKVPAEQRKEVLIAWLLKIGEEQSKTK
jgi:hypothetical protein